MVVSKKAKVKA